MKKQSRFTVDSTGALTIGTHGHELSADTTTELLMKYALQRRGLAMEIAGVLNYNTHEKWSDLLFEHRLQTCPPGYKFVTISQPTRRISAS